MDGYSDSSDNLESDVELRGYEIKPSGVIVPFSKTIDKDLANTWSLSALDGEVYYVEVGGVVQPPDGPAYEIHLNERVIPGTNVSVLVGYSHDPATGKRIRFSLSHPAGSVSALVVPSSLPNPHLWIGIIGRVIVRIILILMTPTAHALGPHDQGGGSD